MIELAEHLIKPIVSNPDDVQIQAVEGESAVVLEAVVHEEDRAVFEDERGRTLRAIRNVLSAAAGRRKATLDLVDAHGASDEE